MTRPASLSKLAFVLILLSFIAAGCASQKTTSSAPPAAAAPQTVAKAETPAYKGTVTGVSEKAETISISVGPEGKTETMMLRFDDKTAGIDYAKKGESVTITYEKQGQDVIALTVKPNLAKLPEGVTEIKTAELQTLIDKGTDLLVIDARPESRFAQSHLPGSVSISVEKLAKEMGTALPKDKEKLLVFYCGGLT